MRGDTAKDAEYRLDDAVDRRMQELGERKEFLTEDEYIEGITPCGRATVERLRLNDPDTVAIRRVLAELGIQFPHRR